MSSKKNAVSHDPEAMFRTRIADPKVAAEIEKRDSTRPAALARESEIIDAANVTRFRDSRAEAVKKVKEAVIATLSEAGGRQWRAKKRCTLQNAKARKVVADVWRHLRRHFPSDAAVLSEIVRKIMPMLDADRKLHIPKDTMGQWRRIPSKDLEHYIIQESLYGEGRGPGIMLLWDNGGLTTTTVAHEMGHAFSTFEHRENTMCPDHKPYWGGEAAANMHAVRWGLTTCAELRQDAEAYCKKSKAKWLKYGPVPGGDWVEYDGIRCRLGEDFVFEKEGFAPDEDSFWESEE